MRTTIAIDSTVRDRLLALKRQWGAPTIEAVLARLLEGGPRTATALFAARRAAVVAVLARHHVKRLVAFGSRARGDARPDSDLDLAVELPAGKDLFDVVVLREELEAAFGLPVHVVSLRGAPKRLRERIRREGVPLAG